MNDVEGFVEYLGLVRAALDRPVNGLFWSEERRPTWQQAGVAVFLHTWARWLEGKADDGSPSWQMLAHHLASVLDADPPVAPPDAPSISSEDDVTDVISFARWLRYLGDDCINDEALRLRTEARGSWAGETPGGWAHGLDLDAYLDAWAACLMGNLGVGRRFSADTWQDFAQLVILGKYYE